MPTSRKSAKSGRSAQVEVQPDPQLIPDDQHPDYVDATISEGIAASEGLAPLIDTPLQPIPIPTPLPINICGPVSGRYTYVPDSQTLPGGPVIPPILNLVSITVRVDVDRFFPQNRISIAVSRRFPSATAHVIAEVTSDQCLGFNHRRIAATITYRDGDAALIPGDEVLFEAKRGRGRAYQNYTLTLSSAGIKSRSYALKFRSRYFDPVEFEVDRVENAGDAITTYDTGSHPNFPADLTSETISFTTVYQRAGFDVTMSPGTTVIPTADAGANGTWSDSEMHNAMITYWSRFADRPQWALWVLFAARHDDGRSLGGVMFDDIGSNHRQGTAIFTDSFIQDVTPGDPNPAAWRQRMVFWTAVHEMGHAFNLAHAWQKALGVPQGAPGDPWIPLTNQPESRSFMNYPFRVAGGEGSFFSDFRFRFTDDELIFMRHAPRRFVQMGGSNWFVNHGFEAPDALMQPSQWALAIRPNRKENTYGFLEPVVMELKLTNTSARAAKVDDHLLADGRHVTIFVQRAGGETRQWRPMITRCQEEREGTLKPGESVYGAHTISTSTEGWLIDEPGFYKVQAAVVLGDEIVVSNVLRLYVAPPVSAAENTLALDYFTEDVGRALVFDGSPALPSAMATLQEVTERCPKNPAALHAAVALSAPMLRNYKTLEMGPDRGSIAVHSTSPDVDAAAKVQRTALLKASDVAADTLGHINYFGTLNTLVDSMAEAGDSQGAGQVMQATVDTMKERNILDSVVKTAERKRDRMK